MRAAKVASAAGLTAVLVGSLAGQARAQERARQRPPVIRVYSENGADVISTTTYVTPAIQVAENAYVFAVAMDLDGQIQVLHPDFPGISVKMMAGRQVRLPNFFAGFSNRGPAGYYSAALYSSGYNYEGDSRGTVIALASRAPFDFEKIEAGGDWNMSQIRRLIEHRSPLDAAQVLAEYIGAKDEPIGRDYMRFAGGRSYDPYGAYGYSAYDPCGGFYGYGFAPLRGAQFYGRLSRLQSRGVPLRVVGYDLCGMPIIVAGNSGSVGSGLPITRPPRKPGDTTVFPKSHFPQGGGRQHPRGAESSAQGVFPLPRRAGVGQMDDVTITSPPTRRTEPGQILQGYRPTQGSGLLPPSRTPIERTAAPRSTPIATGTSAPVYRPEPRVQAPPPSRVSDAPRAAPSPPPTREAPPPRAQAPATTEPARGSPPPPSRR